MNINLIALFPNFKKLTRMPRKLSHDEMFALVIVAVFSRFFNLQLDAETWMQIIKLKAPDLTIDKGLFSLIQDQSYRVSAVWVSEDYNSHKFGIRPDLASMSSIERWAATSSFGYPFVPDAAQTVKLFKEILFKSKSARTASPLDTNFPIIEATYQIILWALQQDDMETLNALQQVFSFRWLPWIVTVTSAALADKQNTPFAISPITHQLVKWIKSGGDPSRLPSSLLPFAIQGLFAERCDVRPALAAAVMNLDKYIAPTSEDWFTFLVLPQLTAIATAIGDNAAFTAITAAADNLSGDILVNFSPNSFREECRAIDTANHHFHYDFASDDGANLPLSLTAAAKAIVSACRELVIGGKASAVRKLMFAVAPLRDVKQNHLSLINNDARLYYAHKPPLPVARLALLRSAACILSPVLDLCAIALHITNSAQTLMKQLLSPMSTIQNWRYRNDNSAPLNLAEAVLSQPLHDQNLLSLSPKNTCSPWIALGAVYARLRYSEVDQNQRGQDFVANAETLLSDLESAGYAAVARAVGEILARLPGLDTNARFAAAAARQSGLLIAPFAATDRNNRWRDMLNQINKAFPANPRKKRECAKHPRQTYDIRWLIEVPPYGFTWSYDNEPSKFRIGFGYFETTSDQSKFIPVAIGTPLGFKKLESSLTENEQRLWKLLAEHKDEHRDSYSYSRDNILIPVYGSAPCEILDCLAAADNICVADPVSDNETKADAVAIQISRYKVRRFSLCPVRIVESPAEVLANTASNGGLTLKLSCDISGTRANFLFGQTTATEFYYTKITDEARKFNKLVDSFGLMGEIFLPAESLDEARLSLAGIAAKLPVRGTFAPTQSSVFDRISAEPVFVFRLKFGETTVDARLAVKAHPRLDEWIEPGVGKGERMVTIDGRPAALTRNLSEEQHRNAEILETLKPFQDWLEEPGHWTVNGLTASLDILAALHGLGDKVVMEWDGKVCHVTQPITALSSLEAHESADHWFSVNGSFNLDNGRVLSFIDLLSRLESAQDGYVKLDDETYFRLTKSLARRLEAMKTAGRVKGKEFVVPPAALPMLDRAFAGDGDLSLPQVMRARADAMHEACSRKVSVPERLRCDLRGYQVEGFQWLSRLTSCGFGVCLADDMGLGKTVQIIALLLERAEAGASLVIAPASLVGNWTAEIRRFAPTLTPLPLGTGDSAETVAEAGPFDIVIASYGLMASRVEQFESRSWNGVVLDEAQSIKNHLTQRSKGVRRLTGEFRIVATGTPVENRLSELWSIFDFLNPGLLSTRQWFLENHTIDGVAKPSLKKLVSPLILRRLKRDVLDDLPEKTEITLKIPLTDDERHAYEGARLRALDRLASGGEETSRISILAELTRLRRFCCHPSLVIPEFTASSKMEALMELLSGLKEVGHRALIFSQFTDYLAIVRQAVTAAGWTHQYLDGSTPLPARAAAVAAFQRGEGDFFIISLKAGGTGLNLTSANYVILLDPWWNPAVENQAADRAHRIGQKLPVTVYRLIAEDTVEERVTELHRRKLQISDDLLSEAGSTAVSEKELLALLGK